MKALEKLGGFILDGGVWMLVCIGLVGLSVPMFVQAYTGGRTVEVSSKDFVCTATSAVGIEPQCNQYTRIKSSGNLQ